MNALLERSSVYIHLDPRKDEVRVPPWFKKQPQLVLQVGLNMNVPIRDLDIGDDAVSCTLSFNRAPFFCYVPWSAVFALVAEDHKGVLWPNDIPQEVAAQQAERAQKEQARERMRPVSADSPKPGPPADGQPAAKPVGNKKRASSTQARPEKRAPAAEKPRPPAAPKEPPAAPKDGKKPLPSYLRVVK